MHLTQKHFEPNNLVRESRATLNDDNSMTSVSTARRTGAAGASMRSEYRNKSKADCIKNLTESLSNDYPNIEVKDFTLHDVDGLDSVLEDVQEFRVPQFMSEVGGFRLIRVPWKDKLSPAEGLSYESRAYPYMLGINADTVRETVRLTMPAGFVPKEVPKGVRLSDSAATYSVAYKYAKGTLLATRTLVFLKSVVNPEGYASFKRFYNDAVKEDNRQILLGRGK